MRNLLITLLLFAASIVASAQGKWETINREGDELKGTKPYTEHAYIDGPYAITMSQEYNMIQLQTAEGIFHTYQDVVHAKIGYYDESGTLIDKGEYVLQSNPKSYHCVFSHPRTKLGGSQKKRTKKIIEYLTTKTGYIRFVVPMYQRQDFDLKVPCINN